MILYSNYKVISKGSIAALEIAVEESLKNNWAPQGGVSFDTFRQMYVQAMVRG